MRKIQILNLKHLDHVTLFYRVKVGSVRKFDSQSGKELSIAGVLQNILSLLRERKNVKVLLSH